MRKIVVLFLSMVLSISLFGSKGLAADDSISTTEGAESNHPLRTILYDTTLLAFQSDNLEIPSPAYNIRANYFTPVGNYVLTYRGYVANKQNDTEFSKATIKGYFETSRIVFFHTHGTYNSMQISVSSPQFISTSDFASSSLYSLQCAVLLACNCGKTVPGYTNMAQTLVNKGAQCVVAFKDSVTAIDCNKFAERLAENTMANGWTVKVAIQLMYVSDMTNNMRTLSVILGNENMYLDT